MAFSFLLLNVFGKKKRKMAKIFKINLKSLILIGKTYFYDLNKILGHYSNTTLYLVGFTVYKTFEYW